MVKFTNEQRLEIIKNYYRNSESIVQTLRALTPIFGRNNLPTRQAVRAIVDKLESTYSLLDIPVPVRQRTGRSIENIAAVSASVQNEPNQSIPRRSQELGISQSTLWRILREDLGRKESEAEPVMESPTRTGDEAAPPVKRRKGKKAKGNTKKVKKESEDEGEGNNNEGDASAEASTSTFQNIKENTNTNTSFKVN